MFGGKNKEQVQLPFEERARQYISVAQGLGIGVGGNEECDIRAYGRETVELHRATTKEEQQIVREQIDETLKRLKASGRPEVIDAIVKLALYEGMLGEIGNTA